MAPRAASTRGCAPMARRELRLTADDFDDIEVVELMADPSDRNTVLLFKRLLGEEGYARLKAELAGESGRTRLSAMTAWLNGQMADLKNS